MPRKTLYQIKGHHDKNHIVRYASLVSDNNLDFLATLHHENGDWTVDGKSYGVGFDGQRAVGICQFYPLYNQHIINDPRFGDYKFQVDECWKKFQANPSMYFNAYSNGSYLKHKDIFELV